MDEVRQASEVYANKLQQRIGDKQEASQLKRQTQLKLTQERLKEHVSGAIWQADLQHWCVSLRRFYFFDLNSER